MHATLAKADFTGYVQSLIETVNFNSGSGS
jgi:hypothetical protein